MFSLHNHILIAYLMKHYVLQTVDCNSYLVFDLKEQSL